MSTLVVVDGSNLVNEIGRYLSGVADPAATSPAHSQRYLLEWFDADRFVQATLGSRRVNPITDLGIVLFRSRKALGTEPYYVPGGEKLDEFWQRQGSNPATSAFLVDLPGPREKGLDTSIVVYLFETVERWDVAVLFTDDADFVPAVWALRRRGKRVLCAAHAAQDHPPLVAACQHFLPWDLDFLRADRDLFEAVQSGGKLESFLNQSPPGTSAAVQGAWLSLPALPEPDTSSLENSLPPGFTLNRAGGAWMLQLTRSSPAGPQPFDAASEVMAGLVRHLDVAAEGVRQRIIVR